MRLLPARAHALLRDLPWADACHAAVVSAAPAIAAVLLGEPRLGWAAIAAFWACFADPGGPLAQRLRAMCWVAGVGAAFCFLGSATQGILWLLLPLTFVCCTLASFAQVWGPAAAVIGTLVAAGFVVSTELPTRTVAGSAAYAAFFIGGSVWAIIMTACVWRRRPWRHAVGAVAQCYFEIASYANALGLSYLPSRNARRVASADVSGEHRRTLRAQIELARGRIGEILDSRPSRRGRGLQLLALLDAVEHAFVVLVALADTMAALTTAAHGVTEDRPRQRLRDASILRVLHRFAQACEITAQISDMQDPRQRQRLQTALARTDQAVRQAHAAVKTGDVVTPTLLPLLDRLSSVGADALSALWTGAPHDTARVRDQGAGGSGDGSGSGSGSDNGNGGNASNGSNSSGGNSAGTPNAVAPWRAAAWQRVRQSFGLRSGITRHAIRVGVAATISVSLSKGFHVNHGYWMSLTVVFILQPYLASTWQRTAQRIVGSVAGAVGASLVGILLPSPIAVAIAVLPIAIGTFIGRTIHYAVFTFFLTLQFVLVAEIQQPALHPVTLAMLRATDSVYGSLLAVLVGVLLWPERSHQRLAAVLSDAVERHARYVSAVLHGTRSSGGTAAALLIDLRRSACVAADNAQTVLQGLRKSPLHRPPRLTPFGHAQRTPSHSRQYDAAAALLSALRGITAAATVIELQPLTTDNAGPDARRAIDDYADDLYQMMTRSAERIRRDAAKPSARDMAAAEATQAAPIAASAAVTPADATSSTASTDAAASSTSTTSTDEAASTASTDAATSADAIDDTAVPLPLALRHPADPRFLALQRIATLARTVERYRSGA